MTWGFLEKVSRCCSFLPSCSPTLIMSSYSDSDLFVIFLWHQSFQTIILVLDMSSQASNGCGHLGNLVTHCNRYRIDRGWGLTLIPVRGFILLLLVQVKPAFLQRIHLLILRIGVPALVSVVQIMDCKVMVNIGNTSLIPFTIEHAGTAVAVATANTDTLPTITTSGSVAMGHIFCRYITLLNLLRSVNIRMCSASISWATSKSARADPTETIDITESSVLHLILTSRKFNFSPSVKSLTSCSTRAV